MVYLGKIENPNTNKFEKNLEQAEILISVLTTIQHKTTGNLSAEEELLIGEALKQMKLGFADANK